MKSIGIDIGASHIAVGLYNHVTEKLENKMYKLIKINRQLDKQKSEEYLIDSIISLIDKMLLNSKIEIEDVYSISLGLPGGIDKEKGIFFGSTELNVGEINLKQKLDKYNTDIFIENDCTCAGICESYFSNLPELLMLTIGSDVGITYIKDFKNINEISCKIIDFNKNLGKIDNRNIKSFYDLSMIYNKDKNFNFNRSEIFKSVANKDKISIQILENYINSFINGLDEINKVFGIKDIYIGGGLAEHEKYFIQNLKSALQNMNIVIAKYKNDAGIIGAALLKLLAGKKN